RHMSATLTPRRLPLGGRSLTRASLTSGPALVGYLALVKFLVEFLTSSRYGYFRDELYYVDASRHLAFGYVDYPPLVALIAAGVRFFFGDSLLALHFLPAVAGGVVVLLAGLMARELGGGRFAQALAALATLVAITFLAIDAIYSMDPFDELWWALAAYLVILIIKRDAPRLWLLFGLVAGIGLETKFTFAFLGLGIVAGLLLTPQRRAFRSKEIWLGGAIALALALPYVLWNAANGWPTLEFWRNYRGDLTPGSPLRFLIEQIYTLNPLTLPLTLAGLHFFFRTEAGRPYRALGWAYGVMFALMALLATKSYFLAPAYPMLFAAGAVSLERVSSARVSSARVSSARRRWVRPAYVALLVASGIFFAPVAMPVLAPPTYARVYGFLGGDAGAQQARHTTGVLPQWLADRFGWPEMAATVAGVYQRLPRDEQTRACILTLNYGEAGALDFYGPRYHLPPVVSGHNSYYLWGRGRCAGQVLITVGYSESDLRQSYASVTRMASTSCAYCMPEEDGVPIYVATQPTRAIADAWQSIKHYNP
ncbi:MAG: glycosyltransferase family 39 protein, partial [Ktedonobacterales bacterium]|nr:glycosyltransferase family 39 protein [Ktedonobacterales bacterium]